jgi:alpha-galactosidase
MNKITTIAGQLNWVIESGSAAYAFGVEPGGLLVHTYWGPRLPRREDYPQPTRAGFAVFEDPVHNTPQEVTTGSSGDSNERTVDGHSADMNLRGFVLRYVSAEPHAGGVTVVLQDEVQGVEVRVRYEALEHHGLFARTISVRNFGERLVKLTRVFSGAFQLPDLGGFALTHIDGRWADEFGRVRRPVEFGTFSRESRRLTTSHRSMPFFALDREAPGYAASETSGEVWFGALQWSGNWKLIAERTRPDRTVVHLGLNDHDFAWDLPPGEVFEAPRIIFGYTDAGFGAMSRAFHDYIRDDVAPRRDYIPPVLYNSWMATSFDVNEAQQVALAEKAAGLGAELFVVDDGWFAGRNHDSAGLGDWYPDPIKFPHGLGSLASRVHGLGMKFGLWLEPEMVNPDSELYRSHPDWIIHFPGRERTLSRNQAIVNFAREDVQEHMLLTIDRLLTDTPIDFIKWDMNRSVSEPGWDGHGRDQRELWVRYVRGVYRVWGELRQRHPNVIWENCSGGGGRVDLGMMALSDQSWISDNTNVASRLLIQDGYSLVFPASTMGAWVADDPFPADIAATGSENPVHYSLDFRFQVSMAGALGIAGDLAQWSEAECSAATQHIARYKSLRHVITRGDLYRLAPPTHGSISGFIYVAKDKSEAVLFIHRGFRERVTDNESLLIDGLDPTSVYIVEGHDTAMSGRAWARIGYQPALKNLEGAMLHVRRQ